jgi:hypothetical protein
MDKNGAAVVPFFETSLTKPWARINPGREKL